MDLPLAEAEELVRPTAAEQERRCNEKIRQSDSSSISKQEIMERKKQCRAAIDGSFS